MNPQRLIIAGLALGAIILAAVLVLAPQLSRPRVLTG